MSIDPQAQVILDAITAFAGPSLTELDPVAARAFSSARKPARGPAAAVSEHRLKAAGADVVVRLYRPIEARGALPAVIYFHGGGFVIGSLDGCDALCRKLAVDAHCAVASVDYRLAPEHKFPAGVEDAFAATCWLVEHARALEIDATRLAVAGESAGGCLAAVVAGLAREQRAPALRLQVLLCPVTDLRAFETPSYRENAAGYLLTRAMMTWFRGHYLTSATEAQDWRCSPLAQRDFAGLPPALIVTAEYDPLRDEGEAYAHALRAAGVTVDYHCYPGMIHTFVNLHPLLDRGRAAVDQVSARLREVF